MTSTSLESKKVKGKGQLSARSPLETVFLNQDPENKVLPGGQVGRYEETVEKI